MSLHHSFDIKLASEFSVVEAILIHHFQYWINFNRQLKRNFHQDRFWSFQTLDEICAHFPYFQRGQVERIINKLVESDVLLKGNFNKKKYDRTVWYAFKDEEKFLPPIDRSRFREMEISESRNGDLEIEKPIPDSKPYSKNKEEHPPNPPEGGKVRVACGAFVKLTSEEKEELEKCFGNSQVEELIGEINDYLASTGKKPYKDYAATIRNWARRKGYKLVPTYDPDPLSTFEKKQSPPQMKTKKQSDMEWFDRLESAKNLCESGRYNETNISSTLMNDGRIWVYSDSVEFLELPEAKFYFGEDGFRNKVDSSLRKLNIVVKS